MTDGVRIEAWSGRQFAARVDDAMAIYVSAMGYPTHTGTQRGVTARRHIVNDGFACRAALLPDGTLVGFGYGYTTLRGQWWHDIVRKAVPRELAEDWLREAFELSELHVLPGYQGHGIGRQLLLSLAAGLPHRALLLSTPDAQTPAPSGCTATWASSTCAATTSSPATRARSRCSGCGCRSASSMVADVVRPGRLADRRSHPAAAGADVADRSPARSRTR